MDEDSLKAKLGTIELIVLIILVIVCLLALNWRDTADKVDKLTEQLTTEQAIEIIATQETTEAHIEPSDDDIQIEIREEFKEGVSNE